MTAPARIRPRLAAAKENPLTISENRPRSSRRSKVGRRIGWAMISRDSGLGTRDSKTGPVLRSPPPASRLPPAVPSVLSPQPGHEDPRDVLHSRPKKAPERRRGLGDPLLPVAE